MPRFSNASKLILAQLDIHLQDVLLESIKWIDFKLIEGHRGKAAQDLYYAKNKSQVKWPNSKHNSNPSKAVDIAPYPIDWTDTERFVFQAGVIMHIAERMNVLLRWGGDWDSDELLREEKFRDYGHFELSY